MLYSVSIVFRQDFVEVVDNHITIGVTAKPVGGKANKEIIKKLAKHFGVSSSNVVIKSGHKSKEKIIEIA
ncbi:MAG: DUF167 domain-containing protein [Nitrososphaeria archaeon]|nr:DUF167 domain-containing protein [Nitrososphaeria archaeon]NDB62732.1 DUF167 domain-containing protein [Nitrosopumilaceae archaeon]NDF24590.1 DUF167 domain-containing protein [Nitrososphaerota archaeon]NDF28691.1 DUF167 domain-containing protein [Nitrososphaeria archaeon]NDF46997.1 DUF167 domain-containing protein [Nitrosopumilaceae archaeon]